MEILNTIYFRPSRSAYNDGASKLSLSTNVKAASTEGNGPWMGVVRWWKESK